MDRAHRQNFSDAFPALTPTLPSSVKLAPSKLPLSDALEARAPLGGLPEGLAFSPKSGLVYIPVSDRPVVTSALGTDYAPDLPGANTSHLLAWDPVGQKAIWRVQTPGFWAGGAIATGGDLVFQGQIDHQFNAYDARSGLRLWSFDARAPAVAPPITFEARGVQYVTVLTGYSGSASIFAQSNPDFVIDYRTMPRRVLTFALHGNAILPPPPPMPERVAAIDPDFAPDNTRALRGLIAYSMNCMLCHGLNAIAGGAAPDLRWSAVPTSAQAFQGIVRNGALLRQGMPRFDDLSPDTVEDIRFYLRSRTRELPRPTSSATAERCAVVDQMCRLGG